jgi:hypothetical protein
MSKSTDVRINELQDELNNHIALKELREFGAQLFERPLDERGLRIFFATTRAFFQDIPAGILALALRVSDDWSKYDEYEATAKGAYILYADVDEFGLHEQANGLQPTHHQLFRDLTQYLGITQDHLHAQEYIRQAGIDLGQLTAEYYRRRSVPEGLGYHLASELTSQREFVYFLKGFQKYQEHYGLTGADDPVLEFFRVHTIIEPMHKHRAKEIIEIYVARDESALPEVRAGALAFMEGFAALFSDLNETIYGTSYRRRMV